MSLPRWACRLGSANSCKKPDGKYASGFGTQVSVAYAVVLAFSQPFKYVKATVSRRAARTVAQGGICLTPGMAPSVPRPTRKYLKTHPWSDRETQHAWSRLISGEATVGWTVQGRLGGCAVRYTLKIGMTTTTLSTPTRGARTAHGHLGSCTYSLTLSPPLRWDRHIITPSEKKLRPVQ